MSIAEYFRHDTLVVSFVGYAKYLYPLSLIQSGKPLEVNLTVQATMLREILVDAAALNANQIMAKAIQSIGQNYPSGPFLMEGFFRETLRQDARYVHLTEAALKVHDKNFQRRLNHGITEEVSLIESRE